MRLYRRGNVYWYELWFNGEHYRKSTRSKNERVAQQILSAFHVALIKGEVGIIEKKAVPKFGEAMKAFLAWSAAENVEHPETAIRYKYSSIPLLKYFRDRALDKITPDDVEQYKTKRGREKAKGKQERLRPATVNRELACLRIMFNHTAKAHPHLVNPVSKIEFFEEDNQQTRVLSFTEQRKYLAKASRQLADVAGIILETGMRPGEVFVLTEKVVDLEADFLRVLKGKTKAAKRQIHLTAAARAILKTRIEEFAPGYLFPNEDDSKRPIDSVQTSHTSALQASKVAHFRPYDLRHTWATRAAQSGIDLVTLAAMMGHSRIQMVLRYAHPTQNHQADAMEKLEIYAAGLEKREQEKAKQEEAQRAKAGLTIVPKRA